MRAFVASMLLLWPLAISAETRSMQHLTKEGFVGTWEAIVQDDSMASGVYQMVVPVKGDAKLIQLFTGGKSKFFGRAASWKLAEGQIKDSLHDGSGARSLLRLDRDSGICRRRGRHGRYRWKAHQHRTNTVLEEWSEPVFFQKGRWVQYFDTASKEGEKILHDAKIQDGHAVPKNP